MIEFTAKGYYVLVFGVRNQPVVISGGEPFYMLFRNTALDLIYFPRRQGRDMILRVLNTCGLCSSFRKLFIRFDCVSLYLCVDLPASPELSFIMESSPIFFFKIILDLDHEENPSTKKQFDDLKILQHMFDLSKGNICTTCA